MQKSSNRSRFSFSALIAASWALLALALLSGCVTQAIHPIYDARTLTFDEALIGTWSVADGDEAWRFDQDGPRGYRLMWRSADEGTLEMEAHLAQIGETRFLNLHLDDVPEGMSDLAAVFVLPLHTVLRVDRADDELKLSVLRAEWAERYFTANPDAIDHTFVDDRVVITAPTEALQDFYVDVARVEGAWEEIIDMRRVTTSR